MGVLPATGTQIQMGRARNAYGLTGQVALRATLGAQVGITTGQIRFSFNMGGRDTPLTY